MAGATAIPAYNSRLVSYLLIRSKNCVVGKIHFWQHWSWSILQVDTIHMDSLTGRCDTWWPAPIARQAAGRHHYTVVHGPREGNYHRWSWYTAAGRIWYSEAGLLRRAYQRTQVFRRPHHSHHSQIPEIRDAHRRLSVCLWTERFYCKHLRIILPFHLIYMEFLCFQTNFTFDGFYFHNLMTTWHRVPHIVLSKRKLLKHRLYVPLSQRA